MPENIYLVATPYHIVNALNMAIAHPDEGHDLVIVEGLSKADSLIPYLQSCKLFGRVLVSRTLSRFTSSLDSLSGLVLGDRETRRLTGGKSYDRVFFNFPNPVINYIFFEALRRANPQLSIHFIEDGVGTYAAFTERITPRFLRLFKLLNKQPVSLRCAGLHVYQPEMLLRKADCPVIRLPAISPAAGEKLNEMLLIDHERLDFASIYFEQPLVEDQIMADSGQENKIILDIQNKLAGFIIKKHPRNLQARPGIKSVQTRTPWEIIAMNDRQMDRKTLITPYSNAVMTPKMIFDKEPAIIFIFKMLDLNPDAGMARYEAQIDALVKLYRHPEKICIPRDQNELDSFLAGLPEIMRSERL